MFFSIFPVTILLSLNERTFMADDDDGDKGGDDDDSVTDAVISPL